MEHNDQVLVTEQYLYDIADAIRTMIEEEDLYYPSQMAAKIRIERITEEEIDTLN